MPASYTTTRFTSAVNSYAVDLPAAASGSLLIMLLGVPDHNAGGASSTPAGWTSFNADDPYWNQIFIGGTLFGYWRVADGTEPSTVTITTTGDAFRGAACVIEIDDADTSTPPEAAVVTIGNGTEFDPPSLTVSWGAEATNYWFTGAFTGDGVGAATITGYPANYTSGNTTRVDTGSGFGDEGVLFVSERTANVATEDPGTFTIDATEQANAFTIGVRGAAAAADPTIDQTTLPDGEVDVAYSQTLTVTDGGTGAATPWTISAGSLPAGLSLNGSTGEISGTPTAAESQTFTVQYERDDAVTATQEYTVTVTADLDGNVTLDGSADDGALVLVLDVATDPVTEVARKTTDASGNYYVGGLTAGDYVVVVESSDGSTADGGMVTVT